MATIIAKVMNITNCATPYDSAVQKRTKMYYRKG